MFFAKFSNEARRLIVLVLVTRFSHSSRRLKKKSGYLYIRWDLHVNNLVMRLRSLNYSFYKLRKVLPVHVMRTVFLES